MTALFVYDDAMNCNVFLVYVEQVLVSPLSARAIVVMDKMPAHKAAGIRNAIEAAGAKLMFLMPIVPTSTPSRITSQNARRFDAPRSKEISLLCETQSACFLSNSGQSNMKIDSI